MQSKMQFKKPVLNHIEEVICAILLGLMAILAFINICVRYLTDYSFAFSEEIEVAGLVYLTLFGAAAAFKRGLHLGVEFVKIRFSPPVQLILTIFASFLSILIFLIIGYFSLLQIRDERALGTLSEALQIPQWIYTLALPIGAFFIVFRVLESTLMAIRDYMEK